MRRPPTPTLFPYTTLFRSSSMTGEACRSASTPPERTPSRSSTPSCTPAASSAAEGTRRSEEHTSELQSPDHLVCRLLLEKKKQVGCARAATVTRDEPRTRE